MRAMRAMRAMKYTLLGKIVLGGSPTIRPKNDGIMGECNQND
jgi:hypothetical protein